MKKRSILAGLAIAAVAVLGLASCGETETPSSETPTSETVVVEKEVKMNGTKYETITAALAAIPKDSKDTFVITLNKGTYEENGLTYNGSASIKISGVSDTKFGADVIIKGQGSDQSNSKSRCLLSVQGTGNLVLENITLHNTFTRKGYTGSSTQCEALGTDTSGTVAAYNCSFKAHQDTVRTVSKAWFYGCYIEGDVDFLWCEASSKVALYENCEIKAIADETTSAYITAPKYAPSRKIGKGLVIYNSKITIEDGLSAYLFRNPWSNTSPAETLNTVAIVNTTVDGTLADLCKTAGFKVTEDLGYKIDETLAAALANVPNTNGVATMTAAEEAAEYAGRNNIVNRMYDTVANKFMKDNESAWDLAALATDNKWTVTADSSKSLLDGEVELVSTVYAFDGTVDQSALCNGFALENGKTHYSGKAGSTITIPLTGKSYVEVTGYYAGEVSVKAGSQGEAVTFFNNGSTSKFITGTYVVYDESATEVVLTANATSYITKVVVTPDASITQKQVTDIEIKPSTTTEAVGVGMTLNTTVTPLAATNTGVAWTSSDEAVASIEKYTGKVTFKAAGTVTFTATALDGSGVTKSITCNPVEPKWTQAEWYTTDNEVATEEGAEEIGNFNVNSSTYKNLTTNYTFRNLAGDEITTGKGLKLNSAGKLSISTVKKGTLTLVVGGTTNDAGVPTVKNGDVTATASAPVTLDNGLTQYTYEVTPGTWDITRTGTSEEQPIVYAKIEIATAISSSTGYNFKGGTYTSSNTSTSNIVNLNSGDAKVLSKEATTLDLLTFEGAESNGTDNWLKFNTGATIKFKTTKAATLKIYFYNGQKNATVSLNGTEVTTASETVTTHATPYEYTLSAAGEVVITAASNGYIGFFEVVMD